MGGPPVSANIGSGPLQEDRTAVILEPASKPGPRDRSVQQRGWLRPVRRGETPIPCSAAWLRRQSRRGRSGWLPERSGLTRFPSFKSPETSVTTPTVAVTVLSLSTTVLEEVPLPRVLLERVPLIGGECMSPGIVSVEPSAERDSMTVTRSGTLRRARASLNVITKVSLCCIRPAPLPRWSFAETVMSTGAARSVGGSP